MKKSFPYKLITSDEALSDYEKLRSYKESKMGFSFIGNKATDYFFYPHRIKVRTYSRRYSKFEAWNDPEHREKIRRFAKRISKSGEYNDSDLRSAMQLLYGSVNQFKPSNAVAIYRRFKPKRVLDFSAGWGGRCLAAMALDIDYTGIDSNKKLKEPYRKMVEYYPSNAKVQMIFQRSEIVDFSKLGYYDMIFTSPPYEMLEKYEGMKDYVDKFYEEFFIPVINGSYQYLASSGILALNMPNEMYQVMKTLTNSKIRRIKMPLQNRFQEDKKV
ncbi:unnamed protein product [Phytophthora lilii]|uniref:site-specific DNA-methyltransferase (cytosine-N(4)-specific) n=1 Tax=Phytophthora lilii TaxID=2077276 RepID=A0A9W6TIT7_9STRA|nr:unnamed protein product [Phytophthora lilii]